MNTKKVLAGIGLIILVYFIVLSTSFQKEINLFEEESYKFEDDQGLLSELSKHTSTQEKDSKEHKKINDEYDFFRDKHGDAIYEDYSLMAEYGFMLEDNINFIEKRKLHSKLYYEFVIENEAELNKLGIDTFSHKQATQENMLSADQLIETLEESIKTNDGLKKITLELRTYENEEPYEIASGNEKETAQVTSVIDGDTIKISTGETVRIIGINSPESGEACFEESKEFLEDIFVDLGSLVQMEKDQTNKDTYGRLLRYVYVSGDMDVGAGMIITGNAYAYPYGADTKNANSYDGFEEDAKEDKIGCLWSTGSGVICSTNYYNCDDFSTYNGAKAVYDECGGLGNDIHYLDGDEDGIPCEGLYYN